MKTTDIKHTKITKLKWKQYRNKWIKLTKAHSKNPKTKIKYLLLNIIIISINIIFNNYINNNY